MLPVLAVMDVAAGWWPVTAGEHTVFVAYGDGEPDRVWPVTDRVGNVKYGALSVFDDPVQGAVTQLDPVCVVFQVHDQRDAVPVGHGPFGWFFPHRLCDHVHERVRTDFRHQPFRVGGVTVVFRAEQPIHFGVDRRSDDLALLRVEGAFQTPSIRSTIPTETAALPSRGRDHRP